MPTERDSLIQTGTDSERRWATGTPTRIETDSGRRWVTETPRPTPTG
jgi:hypothetical protein